MVKIDKQTSYNVEKHTPFFNLARRYYWLVSEKEIGNVGRVIIREYHLLFNQLMNELTPSEFNQVWNRLYEIRLEVFRKKKNDKRNGIKIKNVLDFLKK